MEERNRKSIWAMYDDMQLNLYISITVFIITILRNLDSQNLNIFHENKK